MYSTLRISNLVKIIAKLMARNRVTVRVKIKLRVRVKKEFRLRVKVRVKVRVWREGNGLSDVSSQGYG